MRSSFFRSGAALLAMWIGIGLSPAWALDRDRTLDQFHHTRWTAKEGAPLGIRKMSQTRDGWLWLGSTSGLYRFDGVRFERAAPPEDPNFGTQPVSTLAAGPQGELWIGLLAGGIARIDDQGALTAYELPADLPSRQTQQLVVQPDGVAWANVAGHLLVQQGQTWQRADERWQWPAATVSGLFVDAKGSLWVVTAQGWFQLRLGRHQFEAIDRHGPTPRSARILDGQSWLIFEDRIEPLPDAAPRRPQAAMQPDSSAIYVDRARNLWSVYCPAGLCRSRLPMDSRVEDGALPLPATDEQFARRDGLSSDIGMTVLEDRDGNLWVATQTGLDRFRDSPLARFSPLGSATNFVLLPEPDGLLLGAVDATQGPQLWRLNGHHWRQWPWPSERGRIRALLRDPDGTTWIAASRGLWRWDAAGIQPATPPGPPGRNDCRQLQRNRSGLWVLCLHEGLRVLRDQAWVDPPVRGLDAERPTAFALEGEAVVWTGYPTNRVSRADADGVRHFGAADGLNVGAVTFLHLGRRLLVVGDRGLQLQVGGRFHAVVTDDADALRGVTGAQDGPGDDLWLNGLRGAVLISAEALAAFDRDPSQPVPLRVFDAAQGYPAGATALAPASSLVTDASGGLWFAGLDGVARLDLAQLPAPRQSPAVRWLEVAADQRWRPYRPDLQLAAGTQTVSVRFTALELGRPEQLRFQARLEGVDKDWRDLGPQRELFYSHLPAGAHQLQVRARALPTDPTAPAALGPPATMHFVLRPTLSQTLWFRVGLSLIALWGLGGLVRWRTRQAARQEQQLMRLRMAERERIAQEVQDTLLQGVHGLTLHFQKVANRMTERDPNRALMDTALDRVDQLIERGREQVAALRAVPPPPADLATSLSAFGERLAAERSVDFLLDVDGRPRPLRPSARDELRRLGQAAIAEAFRHRQATRLRVTVAYRWHSLRLVIADDGRPPSTSNAAPAEGEPAAPPVTDSSPAPRAPARAAPWTIDLSAAPLTTATARFSAWRVYQHPFRPAPLDGDD